MPKDLIKITSGKRITIPHEFLEELKLKVGDYILLEWDEKKNSTPTITPLPLDQIILLKKNINKKQK